MSVSVPTIETDRLVLRAPKLDDFEPLCTYFQDPRSRFNGGLLDRNEVWGVLLKNVGQWHLRGHGLWHIALREDDTYVGFTGIFHPFDWPEPELGYGIIAEYEGRGIAYEAACAARDGAARHLGLQSLPSYIAPDNMRSQALARRMGAVRQDDITLRDKTACVYRHTDMEAA
ncbi:GNAT family N-acetyltransferase [Marivita sp.]|uniref:GNAT family N-acetyltransferase n=1 Tax=Marivita sp. TaxID=2003365 RepID=UPI003F6CA52D